MTIINPSAANNVRCDCTVDLIDRHSRPYKFRVVVSGLAPHQTHRIYEITAKDDNSAAIRGMERFCEEMRTGIRV